MSRWPRRSLLALSLSFAVLLTVTCVAGAFYAPNTEIPGRFSGRAVYVDGIPVRVLVRGSGRDVLLIHGSPGSIEDWAPIQDQLSRFARVTAFDRPGHGFSGDLGDYSYTRNAELASRLIDVLQLRNVIVVGHSYGGVIALCMAARTPAKLSGVVVLDSAAYHGSREPTPLMRLLSLPVLGPGIVRTAPASMVEAQIRGRLRGEFRARPPSEPFLAQRARMWSSPKVIHATAQETVGATPELEKISSSYRSIRVPVAILAQADDPFRRRTAQRLHREIRGSSLELLPGIGHFLQFETPEQVLRAIVAQTQ